MRRLAVALALSLSLAACSSSQQVRKPYHLDTSVPVGQVEGDRFVGERIPLTLSTAGTGWKLSTTYPKFLLDQGYEKAGLEQSQVFAYDPATRSSLQISFVPADPQATFSQKSMEWIADLAGGTMPSELDQEYGAGNYTMTLSETERYDLGGVPYAAHKFARYEAKGTTHQNGWIYAFAEPFQIFIIYQLEDLGHNNDPADLEKILSTFRYTGPPKP